MTHLLVTFARSFAANIGVSAILIGIAAAAFVFAGHLAAIGFRPWTIRAAIGLPLILLVGFHYGGFFIRLGAADVQARWDAALAEDAAHVAKANAAAAQRYDTLETARNEADANAARLAAELALSQLDAAADQPPAGKACPLPASPPDPDSVLRVWRGR